MTLHLGETINDVDHLSTDETTHFWYQDTENTIEPAIQAGRWVLRVNGEPRAEIRHLAHGYEAYSINEGDTIVDPNWRSLIVRIVEGELK